MAYKGLFLHGFDQKRSDTVTLSFRDAAERAKQPKGDSLYECLKGDKEYLPYTDTDYYCDSPERPQESFIDRLQEKILQNWCILAGSQGYEGCELKMATRHGLVPGKNKYKLSFRFYLLGFRVKPMVMKDYIQRKHLGEGKFGDFDTAPYSKSQLLGCVGFFKSQEDARILQPHDDDSLEAYMVQNLTGNERQFEYSPDSENNENIEKEEEELWDVPCAINDGGSSVCVPARYAPPWESLERLVLSLNVQKRCNTGTYKAWIEVGWAIAGVSRVAERFSDGYNLWIRFCRQCPEAYNTSKAWAVYFQANTSGPHLGWKALLGWLKEDNLGLYHELTQKLQETKSEITNPEDQSILKQFVISKFGHFGKTMERFVLQSYDSTKYIIVVLNNKSSCHFIKDDHDDGTVNYVVIGMKSARDKCPHQSCAGKSNVVISFSLYPENIKTVIQKYCRNQQGPDELVQDLVLRHKDHTLSRMDDFQIAKPEELPIGSRYRLTKNRFCCICNCEHERPENCVLVTQAAQLMSLGCRLNPYNFYPPGGIAIPQNITNVIIHTPTI